MSEQIHDAEIIDETVALNATEQKQIDKAIAEIKKAEILKVNKTDFAIAALTEKYMGITIVGIEDRDAYLTAQDGYKLVRNHRLAVERKRKEIVEFPNKFLKLVNGEATRIKDLLTPIEEHLKLQVGIYEKAESAEKERKAQVRRVQLTEAGFKFDGAFYVCGVHSISTTQLVDMTDDRLEYYIKEATTIVAMEKAAEERRKQEAIAAEAAQKAIEAERQALAKERQELAALKAEMEVLKASLQTKPTDAEEAERARQKAIVDDFKAKQTPPVTEGGGFVPADGPMWKKHNDDVAAMTAKTHNDSAPNFFEDDTITSAVQPHTPEYIDGFEHCREAVLAIFADPTPRKRGEFVEAIKLVRP